MKNIRPYIFLSCALGALLFVACASQNKNDNDTSAAGTSTSSGGSSVTVFPASTAGTGSSGLASSRPHAGTTPDGTLEITHESYVQVTTNTQAVCQGTAVEAEPDQSVIEFLVDVSGSMLAGTPSTFGKSKWEVTRAAIKDALNRIPPTFGVGIAFYPNMDLVANTTTARPVTACVDSTKDVPIAVADATQLTRIQDALDAISPFEKAATPTFEAFQVAANQLRQTAIPGKRYVVLITDGQPTQGQDCIGSGGTCDTVTPTPTAPIVDAIATASTANGISTFVVGSPGSEKTVCTGVDTRGWLSEAAYYGGTGAAGCVDVGPNYCHFDVSQAPDFGLALSEALGNITKSLISCSYAVPSPDGTQKVDPATTNFVYDNGSNGYFLLLPTLSECDKGWKFTDGTNSEVEICGKTCELLQNNPAAKLTILFGCDSTPILQ